MSVLPADVVWIFDVGHWTLNLLRRSGMQVD